MNILDQILIEKKKEIANRKAIYPIPLLEQTIYFKTAPISMSKYILRIDKSGIIAEFKRKSPSKGAINPYAKVEETSIGYMQAGASALSVLTDESFFGGKNSDLIEARKFNYCPILRKDFVVDEYQLIESKSIGADCILLIAECLDKKQLKDLAATAKKLGLEVLMEIHSAEQLDKLTDDIDLVGVNNRNLETFEVSLQTSLDLATLIPSDKIKISESGISSPEAVVQLKEVGYKGFLIGEHFMKTANPAETCQSFIKSIQALEQEKVKI